MGLPNNKSKPLNDKTVFVSQQKCNVFPRILLRCQRQSPTPINKLFPVSVKSRSNLGQISSRNFIWIREYVTYITRSKINHGKSIKIFSTDVNDPHQLNLPSATKQKHYYVIVTFNVVALCFVEYDRTFCLIIQFQGKKVSLSSVMENRLHQGVNDFR